MLGSFENFVTMISEWNVLQSRDQLETAIQQSFIKPVVIFKHSLTCGISARSKYILEGDWDFAKEDIDFYYLDLLNFRQISNEIESRFGVRHQSPQLIIIKNGEAVYDVSHHRISVPVIHRALDEIRQSVN